MSTVSILDSSRYKKILCCTQQESYAFLNSINNINNLYDIMDDYTIKQALNELKKNLPITVK